jgi:hypothetical protein
MILFIHCSVDETEKGFAKLEWMIYDKDEMTDSGKVVYDTLNYTFDFVQFLIAMGSCKYLVGHNLPIKLKAIGIAMKQNCLKLSVKRPDKIIHLELTDTCKPKSLDDVYKMFINSVWYGTPLQA